MLKSVLPETRALSLDRFTYVKTKVPVVSSELQRFPQTNNAIMLILPGPPHSSLLIS